MEENRLDERAGIKDIQPISSSSKVDVHLILNYYYIHLMVSSGTNWVSWHQKGKLFYNLIKQGMIGWQ